MKPELLIFTDLDGTLLAHDDYSWAPAAEALKQVRHHQIPLIFNSSKTAAEITVLRKQLGFNDPYIVENGGALIQPPGFFTAQEKVEIYGRPYPELIGILASLRREKAYRFVGFTELGVDGVAGETGLDRHSAALACARQCTEPLLWQDSDERLSEMKRDLGRYQLRLVKGGRFYHVMGETDKGLAARQLIARYRELMPQAGIVSLALGDGENDLPMLEAADIAVVIPPHRGPSLELPHHPRLLRPAGKGPYGWQEAMNEILPRYT